MKSIIKKTFFIVTIILSILVVFTINSYCADDIVSDMDYRGEALTSNKLTKGISIVFKLIQYAGTGIALIMVMILGMKYMLSSVEEKAEIKKQAIPIVVGSGFIFAATNLVGIVGRFME